MKYCEEPITEYKMKEIHLHISVIAMHVNGLILKLENKD